MEGRESFRGWLTTSYLFAVLYAVIGAWGFVSYDQFLGGMSLVCALLYGLGSWMASEGNYRTARVMLILGGIPALPLGLVMIIAGVKIGKAAERSMAYSINSPVGSEERSELEWVWAADQRAYLPRAGTESRRSKGHNNF